MRDRHTFQLVVLLQGLANASPLGQRCFARTKWLQLQARQLVYGTPRVQQAGRRLWRATLPSIGPAEAAASVASTCAATTSSLTMRCSNL